MFETKLINKQIIEKYFSQKGYTLNVYNVEIERLNKSQLTELIKKAINTAYGEFIFILDGTKYVIEIYTEDQKKELNFYTLEKYNQIYCNDTPLQ